MLIPKLEQLLVLQILVWRITLWYNPHGDGHLICDALQKKKAMYTAIEKAAVPFCDKSFYFRWRKQSALDKDLQGG